MKPKPIAILLCVALFSAAASPAAERPAAPAADLQQAKQPPSDYRLKRMIQGRMLDARAAFFADVAVDVVRGDVLLTGYVRDPKDKARAAALVRSVPGTRTVVNEIQVGKSTGMRLAVQDLNIERRITASVFKAFGNKVPRVSWRAINGVVYVFGQTRTEWQHNKTLAIIKKTKGVKSMIDHLRIVRNDN